MNTIPVVSFSTLETESTRAVVDAACREWGFFYLVAHGIAPGRLRAVREAMKRFFAISPQAKRAIERTSSNPWGYYDRELTKNVRDWKEIFDFGPTVGVQHAQWPRDLPGFRETMEEYYFENERIATRLVEAIAILLGAEPSELTRGFVEHTSFLRLNHYPVCDTPAPPDSPTVPRSGHLGIGHHTDAGAITVLLQDDRPGLQVKKDEIWHDVTPLDEALVINLGDVVQVWSNDRYRAPVHRVLAHASCDRYSAPFFFNPSYATNYAPLPTACGDAPPRYRSINWGAFRAGRAAGDYADLGEEIQIAHYRV